MDFLTHVKSAKYRTLKFELVFSQLGATMRDTVTPLNSQQAQNNINTHLTV